MSGDIFQSLPINNSHVVMPEAMNRNNVDKLGGVMFPLDNYWLRKAIHLANTRGFVDIVFCC